MVELHGLLSAPQHNGRKGLVVGAATSERISVQLEELDPAEGCESQGLLSVKPSNVRAVPESEVPFGLGILSRKLANEEMDKMQSKFGTKDFDLETLTRQRAKFFKYRTKASLYNPYQLLYDYLTHVSLELGTSSGVTYGFVSYTASGPVIQGSGIPLLPGVPPNFHLKQDAYLEQVKTRR